MSKQDEAAIDYAAGMKYKDIAEKYDVSLNTVKSWRARNGWSRGAPKAKKDAPEKPDRVHPSKIPRVIVESDATNKQKLFALYYLQRFNATWAYMKAYGCSYATANVEGPRHLVKPSIKSMIDELKKEQAAELHVTQMDILQDLAKQARSDVGDYVNFGSEDKQVITKSGSPVFDGETGKPKTVKVPFIDLINKDKVDTSLIKSIRFDKGEVNLELYDKQKAMEMLLKNLPEAQVAAADDGFLDAIDGAADKVWGDEDGNDE